jgi:hypothetical protein
MPTPTVTIMANPSDAEILTLANSAGGIQLVLRNSSDQEIAETSGSFSDELYGSRRKKKVTAEPAPEPRPRPRREEPVLIAAPAPAPPPAIPAAPPEIVVIRGTQRSVEVVARSAN